MNKVEMLYEWLVAAHAKRDRPKVGFRADMRDIERWVGYCMTYKPITYQEFNRLQSHAYAGDIPPLHGVDISIDEINYLLPEELRLP